MYTYFTVKDPYKSLILSGEKTVEGRLNKGKFADLKIWDYLKFEDTTALDYHPTGHIRHGK